ncbi:MAG: hypothetical protein REJ23_02070 [Brevundimonas sp.]|nr:hypothetical protein [Brevundimonas sp.]
MINDANSPDPVPNDDDTAWPGPAGERPSKEEPEKNVYQVIEEGTAVLGTPD